MIFLLCIYLFIVLLTILSDFKCVVFHNDNKVPNPDLKVQAEQFKKCSKHSELECRSNLVPFNFSSDEQSMNKAYHILEKNK